MKFETGKTYTTRRATDADSVLRYVVTRRTNKSVWISKVYRNGEMDEPVRRGISLIDNNRETIFPEGRYSMCPVVSADDMEEN